MRFIIAFVLLVACGTKQVHPGSSVTLTQNKLVDIQVSWIKDKKKKYDIELSVHNISDNDIIFMLNDMQCLRGSTQGRLKHTFFNTGERTIDFRKGQTKQFRMVCDLGAPVQGSAKILINRIFDNPNSDGATKGNVLTTEPIEWSGSFSDKD